MPNATPRITARDLTYGIEIECGISHTAPVTIGGYHAGAAVPALPEFAGRTWRADRDGSLNFRTSRPVEFVSPVLKGAEGLDNIRAACAQIKAWGGTTNRSCGLHVHVSFPTTDVQAMRRLTMLVGQFEDALYSMTGTPDRRDGGYCRSIKTATNKARNWSAIPNKDALRNDYEITDRYRILNWQNFITGRLETVEFRVFSGSVNPAKIAAWVQVCLTLVEMALDGAEAGGWDPRVTNWNIFGKSRGEQQVRYLIHRCWFGNWIKARNYGDLGHAVFTRKAAVKTLKELAKRHDERAGLLPTRQVASSVED